MSIPAFARLDSAARCALVQAVTEDDTVGCRAVSRWRHADISKAHTHYHGIHIDHMNVRTNSVLDFHVQHPVAAKLPQSVARRPSSQSQLLLDIVDHAAARTLA